MYYKVTFKHSENVFCTNIAIADNVEAVNDHYSKYSWVNVRECAEWEVEEGKAKGMPIVTIETKEEPETVEEYKEEKGENKMQVYGEWFYGNKISDYGLENGYVDYGTLAKAFDAVLNNDIVERTMAAGFDWEMVSGWVDNSEEKEELREKIAALEEENEEENADQIAELEEEIEELERKEEETPDIFQWYIVSDSGARLLEEINEIVYYCSELDMYVWGVTHYGTAWSYVLTNIPCNTGKF